MKDPWVACPADNLSDPMVIAATAFGELRRGSVSGTLRFVELARPRWGRAISSLITGVSQLRTEVLRTSVDVAGLVALGQKVETVDAAHDSRDRCRILLTTIRPIPTSSAMIGP